MVYHCSFALCKNDSRHRHKPHMQGITFHCFPNPTRKPEQCARWVSACQRPKFTMEKVSKNMVVCSKHFVGKKGPTEEHPDPLPDSIIKFETSPRSQRRKMRNAERAMAQLNEVSPAKQAAWDKSTRLLPLLTARDPEPRLNLPNTSSDYQGSGREPLASSQNPSASQDAGDAAGGGGGSATLLRSLLTDKGPNVPTSQPSGPESDTSSVDLGLITLAMLAVKTAAKNNSGDPLNQEQTSSTTPAVPAQSEPAGNQVAGEASYKCGCDCAFSSRYRLWLHQSADRPCGKCNKPCMPEKPGKLSTMRKLLSAGGGAWTSQSGTSGALPNQGAPSASTPSQSSGSYWGIEAVDPASSSSGSSSLYVNKMPAPTPSLPAGQTDLEGLYGSSDNLYGPYDPSTFAAQLKQDPDRFVKTSATSYTSSSLRAHHFRGSKKKTQISKAVRNKMSSFLNRKALLSRLDSLLTPMEEPEEEDEEGGSPKCDLCGEEFDKRSELKEHRQRVHWVGTPYSCVDCGRTFSTVFGLDIHKRERAGEKLFVCRQCEFAFSSEVHLQKHRDKQHAGEKEPPEEEQVKCIGGKDANSKDKSQQGNDDNDAGSSSNALSNFRGQRKIVPSKRYTCCYCQKVFRKFKEMVMHKKIHKGEKRFHCPVCGKPCLQSSELKVHMRTHTGERPYKCTMCEKKFSTTSALQSHTRIHTGEKPFACDFCDRRFSDRKYMKAHYRTHTGERRYQCSVCGKMFTQSCALTIHERLHTGNKPFGCDHCGQRFVTNAYLQKHIASVHNPKAAGSGNGVPVKSAKPPKQPRAVPTGPPPPPEPHAMMPPEAHAIMPPEAHAIMPPEAHAMMPPPPPMQHHSIPHQMPSYNTGPYAVPPQVMNQVPPQVMHQMPPQMPPPLHLGYGAYHR